MATKTQVHTALVSNELYRKARVDKDVDLMKSILNSFRFACSDHHALIMLHYVHPEQQYVHILEKNKVVQLAVPTSRARTTGADVVWYTIVPYQILYSAGRANFYAMYEKI